MSRGGFLLALSSSSLKALAPQVSVGSLKADGMRAPSIFPMSVPGEPANLSGQCNACVTSCQIQAEAGAAIADAACAALAWIPWVGGILYAACLAANYTAWYFWTQTCTSNCNNIGSPCCPVPCAPNACCNYGELCLDSGTGLCCPPGTLQCYGPQESCYDPSTEKCLQSGVGCPYDQICGQYNCCSEYETCIDPNSGTCCSIFSACGNECCAPGQSCVGNACCPTAQVCGGTCCPSGTICSNGNCIVQTSCPPGQFLCVSGTIPTTTSCCNEGQFCCADGSCADPLQGCAFGG